MQLLKKGLYDFDADHSQVRVFKGKADVFLNNQKIGLGDNRGLTLMGGGKLKAQSFDERQYTDDCYRWSDLRSGYLAEAGRDTARRYVNGGVGWYGAGWYWDPRFGACTFIPGDGIFYSLFGWGSTRPSRFMVPRFSMADTMAMATAIASANSTNPMDMDSSHAADSSRLGGHVHGPLDHFEIS
jgi:hypothetical protein